jgi:predicted TIM-barrel fold metal-dependent hydrolase
MVFKDINSGFYVLKRPMQYACTHDEVAELANRNGIVSRAIYNYDQSAEANDRTLAYAKASAGKEFPVIRLMPPVYEEETYTRDQMLKLIEEDHALFRVHPTKYAAPLYPWLYDWMLDVLTETKTPVLVSLQELNLNDAAQIKEKYPDLRLIITNTDQWLNRQYVQFAKYYPHVYFDTCNTIEYYGIENMVQILGADKFLFGSYIPEKEPCDKLFQILYCELSGDEKELSALGNVERLVEDRV